MLCRYFRRHYFTTKTAQKHITTAPTSLDYEFFELHTKEIMMHCPSL